MLAFSATSVCVRRSTNRRATNVANLQPKEKRALEQLFQMGGGYLLDFSHPSLKDFTWDSVQRDIHNGRYSQNNSGSKANLMRELWKVEPEPIVAKVIEDLVDAAEGMPHATAELVRDCRAVAARLRAHTPVADLDALAIAGGDFEPLFAQVRQAVENGAPEAALDRLHTLMVRYGRELCASVGETKDKKTPLHNLFGAYVKRLRERGHIQSKMTAAIVRASFEVLDAFNDVRNNHSLAHDNPTLDRTEAMLIVHHVAATVRFLRTLEERVAAAEKAANAPAADPFDLDDDIPF